MNHKYFLYYTVKQNKVVTGLRIGIATSRDLLTWKKWGGEFGRTPYSQVKGKAYGRDPHHKAFSTLLAGGGVKGGTVYGTTDELGMEG